MTSSSSPARGSGSRSSANGEETPLEDGWSRVVVWGTYDPGKPRTRILIRGLREQGLEVVEIHSAMWTGMEDKTPVRGLRRWLSVGARLLWSYPALIAQYLHAPPHEAVLHLHPGHLDALVLRPWARLRGARTILDVFLGLYDTVVEDRRMLADGRLPARLLRGFESLAARAADRVILDTRAQADHFCRLHGISPDRAGVVPVGVEPELFQPAPPSGTHGPGRPGSSDSGSRPTILFYGQMIPLHGIETILRAARSSGGEAFRWLLVGRGQEEWRLERSRAEADHGNIDWIPWVPYGELRRLIADADVCLGIFGRSGKASRVIPNKVYQVLSVGRPLVTRDGPGIRELLGPGPGVRLIPAGDPDGLTRAVEELVREPAIGPRPDLLARMDPRTIGSKMRNEVEKALGGSDIRAWRNAR